MVRMCEHVDVTCTSTMAHARERSQHSSSLLFAGNLTTHIDKAIVNIIRKLKMEGKSACTLAESMNATVTRG